MNACASGEACVDDEAGGRCEPSCRSVYSSVCVGDDVFVPDSCADVAGGAQAGRVEPCPASGPCRVVEGLAACDCSGPGYSVCGWDAFSELELVVEYDACGMLLNEFYGRRDRERCRSADGEAYFECLTDGVRECFGDRAVQTLPCIGPAEAELCVAPTVCEEDPDLYTADCVCYEPEGAACVDDEVRRVGACAGVGDLLHRCDAETGPCVEAGGQAGCGAVVVDRTVYPTTGGADAADLLVIVESVLEPGPEGISLTLRAGRALGGSLFRYRSCDVRLEGWTAADPSIGSGTLALWPDLVHDTLSLLAWDRAALELAPCGAQRALFLTCDQLDVEAAVYGLQPIILEKQCL